MSLIFRIYYIVFSISYPLFALQHNLPLNVLNIYTCTSIIAVVLIIFYNKAYDFSIQLLRPLSITVVAFNLLFYIFDFYKLPNFCYLFSFVMGISSSAIEMACLSHATKNNEKDTLKKQLMLLNFLKVSGIALGFLLGCIVTAQKTTKDISNIIICFLSSFSALLIFTTPKIKTSSTFVRFSLAMNNKKAFYFVFCIVLFILDLTVFSFWYTTLPPALKEKGIGITTIGLLLAVEAAVHAFSQKIWYSISHVFGEALTFFTSLFSHILVLSIILFSGTNDLKLIFLMFFLLGVSNAGTYITSTSLFYSQNFNINKPQLISIHLIASSVGKFLGPFIAIQFIY